MGERASGIIVKPHPCPMSMSDPEIAAGYISRICYHAQHGAYIPLDALREISAIPASREIYDAVFKVINARNAHRLDEPFDWEGLSEDEISIHKIDWPEESDN